jgi:hypothetical protein
MADFDSMLAASRSKLVATAREQQQRGGVE